MRLAFLVDHCLPCTGRYRALHFFLDALHRQGHACRVYCMSENQRTPAVVQWRQVRVAGANRQRFFDKVQADLAADPVDRVIGLDPFPGLDALLALDSPYPDRVSALRGRLYRFSPRYRRLAEQERSLLAPGSATHILLPSASRLERYRELYHTPPERLHLLPPGLGADRQLAEDEDTAGRRKRLRTDLRLESQEYTLLFMASDFAAGGLDRVITTLAHIKEEQPSVKSRLLVAGPEKPGRFRLQARRLKVADAVDFLGCREDIVDLMLASDLLVYPALVESTGVVLLEALAAGLPSVVAEHCGYSEHVKAARAGILLSSPFSQEQLHRSVMRYMDGIFRADCRESGRLYARLTDLGSMYREGADLLQHLIGTGS